jgi:alkaline phosphatase D
MTSSHSRRTFLAQGGALVGSSALGGTLLLGGCGGSSHAAIGVSDNERPKMPSGIQFGDITDQRAIIWSRSDRTAQMIVEYDTSERFNKRRDRFHDPCRPGRLAGRSDGLRARALCRSQ